MTRFAGQVVLQHGQNDCRIAVRRNLPKTTKSLCMRQSAARRCIAPAQI